MWEDALADQSLRHEWGSWGKEQEEQEKDRRGSGQEQEEEEQEGAGAKYEGTRAQRDIRLSPCS